jgi:hypothetical protein
MSDQKEYQDVLSLEDLFLSHEFGRPRVVSDPTLDDTLFGSVPPRGPLVPMAATAAVGIVGHSTTTHHQRQTRRRAMAVLSGAVAALLAAIGAGALAGHPTQAPSNVAIGNLKLGGPSPFQVPTGHGNPATTGLGSGGLLPGGGGSGAELAAFNAGTHTTTVTTGPTVIVVITKPPGTTGGGGSPTAPGQPAPATSGGGSDLLTSVVVLVGHVVSTTGSTVTVATDGLGNALPPLSGVTGLLGNLGGTVTGLGNTLAGVSI